MRNTPLKRRTPLRRKTPLRAKGKTNYARRPRDREYMAIVRRLSCIVRQVMGLRLRGELDWFSLLDLTPCTGKVDPDHMGRRPFGHIAHDRTVVPICRKHHRERHAKRGAFKGWDKQLMRKFCDWAIERTQAEVALLQAKG